MKTKHRILRPSQITTQDGWTFFRRQGDISRYVIGARLDEFSDGSMCVLIRLFRDVASEPPRPLAAIVALTVVEFNTWIDGVRQQLLAMGVPS